MAELVVLPLPFWMKAACPAVLVAPLLLPLVAPVKPQALLLAATPVAPLNVQLPPVGL